MKLFDLDGTLIDSTGVWREVDYQFLSNHKLKPTEEYMANIVRFTFPVAAQYTKEYYHLDLDPNSIIAEWTSLVYDAYAHQIPLKPGALEYLTKEAANGETLVLVTSCAPELGHAVLKRHGLSSLFHKLLFAQELGLEKNDPKFFEHILDVLNISASDCTFYDDSPDNCATAKKTGMTVIGVYDSCYAARKNEILASCDQYIISFRELID